MTVDNKIIAIIFFSLSMGTALNIHSELFGQFLDTAIRKNVTGAITNTVSFDAATSVPSVTRWIARRGKERSLAECQTATESATQKRGKGYKTDRPTIAIPTLLRSSRPLRSTVLPPSRRF